MKRSRGGGGSTAGFSRLFGELKRRTSDPLRHVSFVYALFGTMALGGWAIWLELLGIFYDPGHHDRASLQTALATFFPALIGTTFIQVNLDESGDKPMRAFAGIVLFVSFAVAVWFTYDTEALHGFHIAVLAVFSCIAVWFWWIANAYNETFRDDADAATGGDPLSDLSGSTGDYEV